GAVAVSVPAGSPQGSPTGPATKCLLHSPSGRPARRPGERRMRVSTACWTALGVILTAASWANTQPNGPAECEYRLLATIRLIRPQYSAVNWQYPSIAFSQDGKRLAVGGLYFDAVNPQSIPTPAGASRYGFASVAFAPDGSSACTGSPLTWHQSGPQRPATLPG